MYILLCDWFARTSTIPPLSPFFTLGAGPDRTYDTAITVREVLWLENMKGHKDPNGGPNAPALTTNEFIQQVFPGNNDIFTDKFPDISIIGIPVL